MELTVVLPAFNESENLPTVVGDVLAAFERHAIDGEVLIVDDGSQNHTAAVLAAIAGERCRAILFPENRGRAHALAAGFTGAHGRAVALMDADGQYDPDDLPALLAALETSDVANGVRAARADTPWRRLVSRTYNLVMMRLLLGVAARDANSGIKAFRRSALDWMAFDPAGFHRGHRYLLAWAVASGLTIAEVEVRHRDRAAGTSYIRAGREARPTIADALTFHRTVLTGSPGRRPRTPPVPADGEAALR